MQSYFDDIEGHFGWIDQFWDFEAKIGQNRGKIAFLAYFGLFWAYFGHRDQKYAKVTEITKVLFEGVKIWVLFYGYITLKTIFRLNPPKKFRNFRV